MRKNKHLLACVLTAILVFAGVVLLRGCFKHDGVEAAEKYGKEYGTEVIAKVQGAANVEFAAKRLSYDHKSTCVVGSETRLQPALFPVGATLIPADDSINETIQTMVASMALKQVEVVDVENYTETPDGIWGGQTLTFYLDDKATSGIMFDMASGALRQKIQDETKENYIILFYEIDPLSSDLLIQMLSING